MKKTTFCFLFVSTIYCHRQARAYEIIKARIECENFWVSAETIVDKSKFPFGHGPYQRLRLINKISGFQKDLALSQHWSPSPELGSRKILDALAFTWRCYRAHGGVDYLFVNIACTNEAARTCQTAMDMPGSEWTNIYDSQGHSILNHQSTLTQAEEDRLHSLGLWQEFIQSSEPAGTKTRFIYLYPGE